jgi:reactive intermediate/imine deaminase
VAQKQLVLAAMAGVWLVASARAGGPALQAADPQAFVTTPAFAPISTHGGLVYVAGILPPSPMTGDITGQAASVLDELKARLAGAGTSIDRVVSASVYLASAGDFAAMNTVWTRYFPAARPTRTTIVAQLPVAGARLQVSAIAAAPATSRDVLAPAGWASSGLPYSPAIRVGDTLFLSGMISRRGSDNAPVKGDIETQTRTIFENAKTVLDTAGLTFADVVSARVFLANAADFDRMNAVYRTYFSADPPARATVMAALTAPDYLIEVTLTAVKGGPRVAHLTPNADGSPGQANPVLSPAIGVGPRLFLSGMLGIVPGAGDGVAPQTAEALGRLERTMARAGFGWPQVVDSVVYVTDLSAASTALEAFRVRAGGRLPAGTLVGTGLMSPAARVEIMLTAGK